MLYAQDIKFLIIHCSDTPDTENIGAVEIHKMHLGFGWDGIGYHKIIRRDGQIESGRPDFWVGAHTYGKNTQSLGVCLIGRNKFTKKQFLSLKTTIKKWRKTFPDTIIKGHYEAIKTEKTCPNFDVNDWCLKEGISKY
jgi:N-acetylmuramoyl-L-alanine amidase